MSLPLVSDRGTVSVLMVNGRQIDFGVMRLLRLAVELHLKRPDLTEVQKDRIYGRALRKTLNRRRYLRRLHRRHRR